MDEVRTETDVLVDILKWSKDWPEWQRDALRRLCREGELKEGGLDALTEMCKNKGKGSVALTDEHVPNPGNAETIVNLKGIHSVENVNALKTGERLTFDKTGLTVVYGDNGSGKSGYARILKKVCRARTPSKDNEILPNIYETKTGPQEAVIDFNVNSHNRSEEWKAGKASDPLLTTVSVFDRHTANVHVDQTNDVAYTPLPMQILERLAEACREVASRIRADIHDLELQTPASIANPKSHHGTSVGRLVTELSARTNEQDVHALATLDAVEKTQLETLKTDLGTNRERVARRLIARKAELDGLNARFKGIDAAASDMQFIRLVELYRAYGVAQAAAVTAARDLFSDEPLTDVGSDVWRGLWEAARAYSERQAYPDMPFPFTGAGARCVLCQQELDDEASARMERFERFVKDETKRKERETATAYHEKLEEIEKADIPIREIRTKVALIRDELGDEMLSDSVRRAAVTAKWRLRAILRRHSKGDGTLPLPTMETWPNSFVAAHGTKLSERVAALRAEDESDERKKMQRDYEELIDREWLAVVREDVIAEIGRRKKCAELRERLNDTTTNRISIKSREVANRLVTNALRARFSRETEKLGIAGLAIELRKEKASYGVPLFRVRLSRGPDTRVGDILSEGEHRCVALAAFLAELAVTEGRSAIVFDDPVSSLDHVNREAVAKRIAEEGEIRQTVVFTHDISFLFLLDKACRDNGIHIAFRSITRNDDHAGFCQQDPPAHSQPVSSVIESMQKRLNNERTRYETGDHLGWETTVDGLQKRLRLTWERAVEDAVGSVVKRLSNKVETKGLAKVTAVTLDDCREMRQAYGRCSTLLHSSADELNRPLPKPDAVQNEITALRKWVEDIKQRQGKIDWLQ